MSILYDFVFLDKSFLLCNNDRKDLSEFLCFIKEGNRNHMKFDGIIFDLDGTLWDTVHEICETWNLVLEKHPHISKTVTEKELRSTMGLPIDKIGERLFPMVSKKMQLQLLDECGELEISYLNEHGGTLYADLEPVLKQLSEKYPLFIVSNCQCGYIESFLNAHHMKKYFKDYECFGNTGLSKGENNCLVIERNQLQHAVYVGDTQGDADSAKFANIPFIYAAYGFGAVEEFDFKIKEIHEILEII